MANATSCSTICLSRIVQDFYEREFEFFGKVTGISGTIKEYPKGPARKAACLTELKKIEVRLLQGRGHCVCFCLCVYFFVSMFDCECVSSSKCVCVRACACVCVQMLRGCFFPIFSLFSFVWSPPLCFYLPPHLRSYQESTSPPTPKRL